MPGDSLSNWLCAAWCVCIGGAWPYMCSECVCVWPPSAHTPGKHNKLSIVIAHACLEHHFPNLLSRCRNKCVCAFEWDQRESKNSQDLFFTRGDFALRVNIHLDSRPDGIIELRVDPATTRRSLADCDADFSYDLGHLKMQNFARSLGAHSPALS